MQLMGVSHCDPSTVHPALKKYLGYLLHQNTLLFKARGRLKLDPLQIQGYHLMALQVIEETGSPINQNQLCQSTGVDKATMVKTIDHLEKLGYVERVDSKNDRRVKNLHLTRKGKSALAQAHRIRGEYEKEFLSPLTSEEAESFRRFLLRLLEHQSGQS